MKISDPSPSVSIHSNPILFTRLTRGPTHYHPIFNFLIGFIGFGSVREILSTPDSYLQAFTQCINGDFHYGIIAFFFFPFFRSFAIATPSATQSEAQRVTVAASKTFKHVVSVKLDDSNYLQWKQQVEGVLRGTKLVKCVVSPIIPPVFLNDADRETGSENPAYTEWESGTLLLFHTKYIRDILTKANMANANSMASPMAFGTKLSKYGSNHVTDPTFFRSIVGGLQYATVTRPEISYSINKVCQFLSSHLEDHWKAVKRILRYLQGTLRHGLLIKPAPMNTLMSLIGFCDAD
jgi:hypothetical protein